MSLLWIVRSQSLLLLLIAQLVISFLLIYHQKNKLSYISEIALSLMVYAYNNSTFEIMLLICYLAEYILMKAILVLIVLFAKYFAFYVMVVITHPKMRFHKFFIKKKHFLKIQSKIWRKVNYGIRLKKGIPSMVSKKNKMTGVQFDKDGFPKFKVIATVKLEKKLWKKGRTIHFYHASKMLYDQIRKNSRLAAKFTKREIAEFKNGNLPSKYTWHHHQDKGVMQLVERKIHAEVRHDGGFAIWGGAGE